MRYLLALCLLFASHAAFGQRCTSHVGITTTSSGYTQVIAPPADTSGNLHICAIYVSVTQGATPANYQVVSCPTGSCTTVRNLSPLWTGHASYLDFYNFQPNEEVQMPVIRGEGVYLYLSSAPTSAQVQVFYAFY